MDNSKAVQHVVYTGCVAQATCQRSRSSCSPCLCLHCIRRATALLCIQMITAQYTVNVVDRCSWATHLNWATCIFLHGSRLVGLGWWSDFCLAVVNRCFYWGWKFILIYLTFKQHVRDSKTREKARDREHKCVSKRERRWGWPLALLVVSPI